MAEGHAAPVKQGWPPGTRAADPCGRNKRAGCEGLRAEQTLGLEPTAADGMDLLCPF